jgi:site-specific DNA recombinase
MERPKTPIRRCAIYTRKSSEEGLEQDFNSLHAQREACEAFTKSQASEGWRLFKAAYDDGGLSGGTMERPALQRLLSDINQSLIDVVVVYKVDRLTRSLTDFAKMVEVFDARGVSFVAVTQQFNTTTSMGRLTLNVLLSFAQFEREVTGERIRDKIAASKQKGMWMGGLVPLGYDVIERLLVVNQNRSGDGARDLSPILGTRFCPAPYGGSESPRHQIQSSSRKEWKTIGRESVLPWCALCAAFKSHLHWRDSSQRGSPSWPA